MFRAGDVVKHAPTGEEWVLACDEFDGRVMPCGWPETLADASDCALVKASTDAERLAMLERVSGSGSLRSVRAMWQFKAAKGAGDAVQQHATAAERAAKES